MFETTRKFTVLAALVFLSACGPSRPTPIGGTGGSTSGGTGGSTSSGTGGSTSSGTGGSTSGGTGGSTSGGTGGGTAGTGGSTGFAGTVVVVSSGNHLPPAWVVTDATVLKSDASGAGAKTHAEELVTLNTATTSSNTPCPLPYTSGGKTYCDGFNAKDSAQHAVVVDTFNYLGANPACKATLPTSGQTLSTITGVWEDSYDPVAKTDTWALALTDCAGVGQGTAYAGTNTPPVSTAIHTLITTYPGPGQTVTVSGVVVATRPASSSGSFGFSIEDPAGGEQAALKVSRSKSSTSTAASPAVGDYVTVTGTTKGTATSYQEIAL